MNVRDAFSFSDLAEIGDRVALRLPGKRTVTFSSLHRAVAASAAALTRSGCARGDRVALLMPPSDTVITTFFGALYSGLVPAILSWPTAKMDADKYRRNVGAVVANLKADWLVTDAATAATLGAVLGSTRVIDPGAARGALGAAEPSLATNGPAFIQFSGGTTGTQKSVPISYETLGRHLAAYGRTLAITPEDHVISWLPLYHDMGLVACLLLPFVYRVPVTLFSPMGWVMDPTTFLEEVGRCRATLCWLPNFAYPFMASRVRADAALDLSSLRAVINCSEPVRAESMDAFATRFAPHGLQTSALHACYAMAETTFAVTQTTDADPPRRFQRERRTLVSCGRTIPGMGTLIVDDRGVPVPDGRVGEIWLRGASLMPDYLDQTSRSAFTDEWYRTGDLGTVVDEHLYVTGRKKDLVIVGGINIYPEDVEAAVSAVDGIHPGRAVAMGFDDEERGTEKLVVVAEMDSMDGIAYRRSLELLVRQAVIDVCGIAAHRVFIVPPKWIIKSTAGKISRVETKHKVAVQWDALAGGSDGQSVGT